MNKKMTLQQYRNIDLTILLLVLLATQFATHLAATRWFADQLYVVSPLAAVTAIVMMRWGWWAAIHAFAGGLFFTAISGGQWQQYVIYGIGNLLCMPVVWCVLKYGKERIRKDSFLSGVMGLSVQLLMMCGRALMAAILGYGWNVCIRFITTEILSVLFTLIIIGVVRKCDGLFEDQKMYLLRINREHKSEGRERF